MDSSVLRKLACEGTRSTTRILSSSIHIDAKASVLTIFWWPIEQKHIHSKPASEHAEHLIQVSFPQTTHFPTEVEVEAEVADMFEKGD